jgi:branched-chain amino acid transport system substrate-binding protein
MTSRRQFCLTSFVAAIAASGTSFNAWAQPETPIVLGQSAAFTGPSAQLGIQFYEGAKLHFDSINAKGGVNGRTIELRKLDDGYEPERSVANTKQFIADGVFALFGYIGTPTSLAALPLASEAKIPFFAPFTGAQSLREPFNRYAVHVRASYFEETAAIVKQITSTSINKVAVFYQNDAYGKTGLEGVQRALKTHQLQATSMGTVERNSVDVKKAVADIMASKPEAIVQISAYKSSAAFIREARKAGFGGTFYNVSFVGTQALADELGKEARGVVVSQVMPHPFSYSTPIATEFQKAVHAQAGSNKELSVNYSSMEGFVAAQVFTQALGLAGRRPSREAFLSALEGMHNAQVGGFAVAFGPAKHTGSHFVDMTILSGDGHVLH